MSITSFSFPTPIKFGAGARRLVAAHLLELGLKRPLIVTDRGLASTPIPERIRSLSRATSTPLLWAGADQNLRPDAVFILEGLGEGTGHRAGKGAAGVDD